MRHEAIGRNKIKHVQPFHSVQSSGAGGLISPIVEEAGLLSLSERLTYVLNRTRRSITFLGLTSLSSRQAFGSNVGRRRGSSRYRQKRVLGQDDLS